MILTVAGGTARNGTSGHARYGSAIQAIIAYGATGGGNLQCK